MMKPSCPEYITSGASGYEGQAWYCQTFSVNLSNYYLFLTKLLKTGAS